MIRLISTAVLALLVSVPVNNIANAQQSSGAMQIDGAQTDLDLKKKLKPGRISQNEQGSSSTPGQQPGQGVVVVDDPDVVPEGRKKRKNPKPPKRYKTPDMGVVIVPPRQKPPRKYKTPDMGVVIEGTRRKPPSAEVIIRRLDSPRYKPPVYSRRHSLGEIKRSHIIRDTMPAIDIQAINFEFGSADISRREFWKVEEIAIALRHFLRRNRQELFLLEGHTDAVGSHLANYNLSIRRARSLRRTLVRHFGIEPYSLEIEGYGEEFLAVYTQAPEWRNRRVTIRRLTGYARR